MKEIIMEMIRRNREAFMPYHQYIELALYHPKEGYYMREQTKIGRGGDFYTTPSMGAVFGEFLGKWLCRELKEAGLPPVICELGGGSGQMASNVLKGFAREDADFALELVYYMVEASPYHRASIEHLTGNDSRVRFLSDLESLSRIEGIIFSNEFFDAFPVDVAVKQDGEWKEAGITIIDEDLGEATRDIRNEDIRQFIREWDIPLFMNRIEIPLQMIAAYEMAVDKLARGLLLTIDYGMDSEEWFSPIRKDGTLRAYRNHRLLDSILDSPGEADITFTVPFDLLRKRGAEMGCHEKYWGGQAEFLIEVGILEALIPHADADPFSLANKRNRQIRQLIMGESISDYFRVLLQEKGNEKP